MAYELHSRPEVHGLSGVARLRLSLRRERPRACCLRVCSFDVARRFCAQVLTDVIHICDSKLTYYPGSFRDFQRLRPEIAAGLPSPAGAVQRAKAQLSVSASSNSLNGGDGETKARDDVVKGARTPD